MSELRRIGREEMFRRHTGDRKGTRRRSWLRHCATSRKGAGSIPGGVIGIFHWHNPSGPGIDSASNRNEYREYFLGGKGGRCVGLTTLPPSCADCLEIWEIQLPGMWLLYRWQEVTGTSNWNCYLKERDELWNQCMDGIRLVSEALPVLARVNCLEIRVLRCFIDSNGLSSSLKE